MTHGKYKSAARYQLSALTHYPGLSIVSIGLAIVSAYLTTIPMVIVGDAVDLLQLGLMNEFVWRCWLIVGLAVGLFASTMAVGYAFAVMTQRWERDARQEFFEIVQDNSMTFHDQVDSRRLLSVAMQDVRWVRFSLSPALRQIIVAIASLIIASILLSKTNLPLGMISIPLVGTINLPLCLLMTSGAPLYVYLAYRYANMVEAVRRARSEQMETLTTVSQEVFRGIEVVRAFGAEQTEESKFNQISKKYEQLLTKEGRLAAFYLPSLVLSAITTAAFLYAAYQVLLGAPVSALVVVVGLLVTFDLFSLQLPRFLLTIRGGYVNAQRIVNLLDWKDPFREPKRPAQHVDWSRDIVFDKVSFVYASNDGSQPAPALKNLSLKIPGGSRVALIGGPGGGKSTILKLLLRLYDPTEGRVLVGGVDLRQVSTRNLRNAMALVEQDIFLFRMSIRDNIGFGCRGACDKEVVEAAKRAQAHEFITAMPNGYDTIIGERGTTLSGGQRQRLAIARALVQNPQILLLDDSVSAIDVETEYHLRKALDEVMRGRTSITVTQRLRTLLESDLILIVDKGQLLAAGTHRELLKTSEHYRRIFERLPGAMPHVGKTTKRGGGSQ
jgi:ATP-binding cassette subfamily B protein